MVEADMSLNEGNPSRLHGLSVLEYLLSQK